jgi:signal transduction histidine kinase/DNA-binding response OmpR family regulator
MNALLLQQIGNLLIEPEIHDPRMQAFLEVVGKTYDGLEENKDFLANTLEIASKELTDANERLRRESESRLRHISDYFEETLAQQPNIIFRCRKAGDGYAVRLARGRLLARFGLKPEDLENEGISGLIKDPAKLDWFHLAWQGADQRFETVSEQAQLTCHVWLHPLMENGRVFELIGIVSDITLQKAAEDRLRQTSEDLERRAEEQEKSRMVMLSMIEDLDQSRAGIARERDRANTLAAEAAAANRAKSDFLATMSHEIRTPMNGVLGFTQLLLHSELTAQQQEFITAIRSSAESLLRVINDVLDFSKIESGHMEIEATPFSLEACVEESLETVSTAAAEKHLDLAARMAADVPASIIGDSLRLRQVLVNLLGNAVKFTSSGTVKLEVSAAAARPGHVTLHFRVSDSGIGIAPDKLGQLFRPFHQEDSSTSRRFGGSGLGLAICRRLLEFMGGTISVESQAGHGSVFSFEISVPVAIEPQPVVAPIPFPDLVGRRALVVDRHDYSREVITELLGRWGMELRAATSQEDALSLLADWQPQVLLLDSGCVGGEDSGFIASLARQGVALFLMCQPGDSLGLRERFGDAISGILFKPLKVSPLFNSLLAEADRIPVRMAKPSQLVAPGQSQGRPLRLLLAEDNAINRKLALAALAQMGCTADVAVDGHEALKAAKSARYDAILMDVQMPGMDGLEATRRIRQWEMETGAPPVRIIALTANALAGDREICLKAGMDDYLSKPIRLEILRNVVLLKNTEPAPAKSMESPTMKTLRQLADMLSPEDAVSLASDFLADLDAQLQAVNDGISLGNSDEAGRSAHSLRGAASIFTLTGLQAAAETIENACRHGRMADADAAFPLLRNAARDAVADLRCAISSIASTTILEPMS